MLDALPMADRHAYALERLVEMSGAVVEDAFKRVTEAGLLDEQADQLDPDGTHRAALAQINARWAMDQTDPGREPSEPEVQRRRGLKRLRRRDPDAPPGPGQPRRRSG